MSTAPPRPFARKRGIAGFSRLQPAAFLPRPVENCRGLKPTIPQAAVTRAR